MCHGRMKKLLKPCDCLLGCGWDADELDHYLCCSVYWRFVHQARPHGLGLSGVSRSRDAALLLDPTLTDADIIRLSAGLYALYRTVNFLRFSNIPANTHKLLNFFARRGLEHHASFKLLL